MIQYFNSSVEKEMIDHAKEEFPNESCGIIYNGEYIPCENIATDKRYNFEIDPKKILNWRLRGTVNCIVHSHADEAIIYNNKRVITDYGHASKDDMIRQKCQCIPYGIVHLGFDGGLKKVFYFGDELPVQDLLGRTFIHGVYDCYGLLRDYYRKIFKVTLPQYPRQFGWWNNKKNSSLLLDYVNDADFFETHIDEFNKLRHGDAVFMTIRASMVNHMAVYVGNGLIMHHLAEQLSKRDPLAIYKDNISKVFRYEGVKDGDC